MSEKNKKKNGMTSKEKETLIGTAAGLGASAAVGYPTIKKLSKMMEENMKKEKSARGGRGGGNIASQFGMGKRGAEKMRKSPFELKKGGVVKMRGGGMIAQDRMKPTKIT